VSPFTQRVRIENRTGSPIEGPVSFVLDGLTEGTTVLGTAGFTACAPPTGSPFITLDLGDGILSNRERIQMILEFIKDSAGAIAYTARVLSGAGDR
jgi:hypothetical protein